MGKDSEHLLVKRLDYGCVEIRWEGRVMLCREELLVRDAVGYIGHDEI